MEQVANFVQGCVSLLARFMLVAIFLFSAFDSKIRHFSQTAEYMGSEGIPILESICGSPTEFQALQEAGTPNPELAVFKRSSCEISFDEWSSP